MDKEEVEIIVSDRISHARLELAEKRLNFLLWFGGTVGGAVLVIFGIILPIWLTGSSTQRIDNAIESMERRFEELVGKQLRRPLIECSYQNKSLEGQSVDCIVGESNSIFPIIVRNVGDGSTNLLYCRLYLASDELPSNNFSISWWHLLPDCDESPEYTLAYDYVDNGNFLLHPQMPFPLRPGQWKGFKKGSSAKALLKVYYGEPEPRRVKFSINFK